MKRLIVCSDGTWNTPEQEENNAPAPTNVVRLYHALADTDADGAKQMKYYHSGVGTEGGFFARTAGGAYGAGIDKNIMSAYGWLALNYVAGDAIYLFGFSRGAYTVRSLGGFIAKCGMPVLKNVATDETWKRIDVAYQRGYQRDVASSKWREDWPWIEGAEIPIAFVGVWDTVGALGIPDDMALLNLLDQPDRWRFYDTKLGPSVQCARHAVAIDELRANFSPTLWTDDHGRPLNDGNRVKQLWFPGVHSDVGGGYADHAVADIALDWMITEAGARGLRFVPEMIERSQIDPNPRGVIHNSCKGVFKGLRTQPRAIPSFAAASPDLHASALTRYKAPPIAQGAYHPSRSLQKSGDTVSVSVFASQEWNETGIYLEAGVTYDFTATGQWVDKSIPCGPGGASDGQFHVGEIAHIAGSIFGKLEGAFQKLSGNEAADFKLTRRVEEADWFSLIGVIANGGNPLPDGSVAEHEHLLIGDELKNVTPKQSGYLYAFANDAWHFYDNNRGSVTLNVARR